MMLRSNPGVCTMCNLGFSAWPISTLLYCSHPSGKYKHIHYVTEVCLIQDRVIQTLADTNKILRSFESLLTKPYKKTSIVRNLCNSKSSYFYRFFSAPQGSDISTF